MCLLTKNFCIFIYSCGILFSPSFQRVCQRVSVWVCMQFPSSVSFTLYKYATSQNRTNQISVHGFVCARVHHFDSVIYLNNKWTHSICFHLIFVLVNLFEILWLTKFTEINKNLVGICFYYYFSRLNCESSDFGSSKWLKSHTNQLFMRDNAWICSIQLLIIKKIGAKYILSPPPTLFLMFMGYFTRNMLSTFLVFCGYSLRLLFYFYFRRFKETCFW